MPRRQLATEVRHLLPIEVLASGDIKKNIYPFRPVSLKLELITYIKCVIW
jgi:hypothetical protein